MPVELTSQQKRQDTNTLQEDTYQESPSQQFLAPDGPAGFSQGKKAWHATVTMANLQINQAMGTKHGLLSRAGNTKI